MLLYHCLSQSTRRAASLAEFLGQAQRRHTQCAYTAVCQCQLACTSLCPGDATPSSWSSTLPCLVLAQLKQIENAVITLTIIHFPVKSKKKHIIQSPSWICETIKLKVSLLYYSWVYHPELLVSLNSFSREKWIKTCQLVLLTDSNWDKACFGFSSVWNVRMQNFTFLCNVQTKF